MRGWRIGALSEVALSQQRIEANRIFRKWAEPITGRVLSIGSGKDQDKEGRTYREYFKNASVYHTSEPFASPHCDLVVDVMKMREIENYAYDCVFCSGVLEHVQDPFSAADECYRVLSVGGVLLLGVPFAQPLHRMPEDYWRFTESAVKYLLRRFAWNVVSIGPAANPWAYLAHAVK